ncbi:MAG: hypothetical protein ACM3ZU_15755 [Bacteroidota bacterium]
MSWWIWSVRVAVSSLQREEQLGIVRRWQEEVEGLRALLEQLA